MNLISMIHNHSDSVLETLTSKGLLKRAKSDLESGKGEVRSIDKNAAEIIADGQTVKLNKNGPTSSSCTCIARGVCRHILLATLLLRNQIDETADEPETTNALTQVCSLTNEQVAKFAGSDWEKAIGLAGEDLQADIEEQGQSITIKLPELEATVTIIAGMGIKEAAYKGPKTRKRLLVTVATLMLRKKEGIALSTELENASKSKISLEFIDQAQQIIEQAVSATLPSRSELGRDLFLDLAISTRCESLPRLSAELKALAEQSSLATDRNIGFEASSFVKNASRSYALLEALRSAPLDPLLTGVVRREYTTTSEVEIWPLGVSRWRSKTGARGLSAYIYDPKNNRWLTVIEGRGSGLDHNFNVSNAYNMSIWGTGALSGVIGRRIQLHEPQISKDGLLSSNSPGEIASTMESLNLQDILDCGATHRHWSALKEDLANRMGVGIRRKTTPISALIAPTSFGRIGFNDLDQSYHWELVDKAGDSLVLSLPAEDDQSALRLWHLGKKIQAILVEARLDKQELNLRPVSVLIRNRKNISIQNIDFDHWPYEGTLRKSLSKFSEIVSKPLTISSPITDSVGQVISDATEELVSFICNPTMGEIETVLLRLESCGLITLANALKRIDGPDDLRSTLKAGYLASEINALQLRG